MAVKNLTAEYLRQILHYDRDTGIFTWAMAGPPSNFKPGDRAGGIAAKGHIAIKIDGQSYKAHRLAWLYVTGEWPKDQIDHRNGVPDDNRFENLRECNNAQNCQNQGMRSNNTSGYQGVHWHPGSKKWAASISVQMRRVHLGYFKTAAEAGAAYAEAKLQQHIYSPAFLKTPLKSTN